MPLTSFKRHGHGDGTLVARLWLDADFEDCYVLESDATYASGKQSTQSSPEWSKLLIRGLYRGSIMYV